MKFGTLPITLRQLQYVSAVAQTLNFRKAAKLCHVSQPSLSNQIKEVESMLGVQLFERSRRGVLLTQAGTALLPRIADVLGAADALVEAAGEERNCLEGTLSLGVIPTVAPYMMPVWDKALRDAFPRLSLFWHEEKTENLLAMMHRGELDAALLADLPSLQPAKSEPILRDHFVLAVSEDHPLGQEESLLSVAALQDQSVLLLEDGHCFRDQALDLCSTVGAGASRFRANSLSTLLRMVVLHKGVTILPKIALEVEGEQRGLVLREFVDPPPHRTLVIAWRPEDPRGPAFRSIAQLLGQ